MNFTEIAKIDVSNKIEKKGRFNYLSWTWAYSKLMEIDNNATYEFKEPTFYHDGSVMVCCVVTAFDKSKTMHLPVMDSKNNAMQNPSAMDINKAMQRCLVKAIAMHGLGLYIYSGEDLPEQEEKSTNVHIEYSDDEVTPEEWLSSKISMIDDYATKPKSCADKLRANYDSRTKKDPIYAKLNDPQVFQLEEAIKSAEHQLKQRT